jgi:hypothetical protein
VGFRRCMKYDGNGGLFEQSCKVVLEGRRAGRSNNIMLEILPLPRSLRCSAERLEGSAGTNPPPL